MLSYELSSLAQTPSVSIVHELTFDHDCIPVHHPRQKRHDFAANPFAESPWDIGGHPSATLRRARGGSQTAFLRLSSPDAHRHFSIGFVRGDPPITAFHVFAGSWAAGPTKA